MPELTREELYDLVWSKRIRDAAESVSMSHTGLYKICRRHLVPMPPRGYWSRLQAGRPMPKIPLAPDAKHPRIELRGVPKRVPRAELVEARSKAIAALRMSEMPAAS